MTDDDNPASSWIRQEDQHLLDWLAEDDDPGPDTGCPVPDPWEADWPALLVEPTAEPVGPTRGGVPRSTDPLSLRLLSDLAQRSPAGTGSYGLITELGLWQKFTGFSTARIWTHLGELHTRYTSTARSLLDVALSIHDTTAAEHAADDVDLAERSLTAEIAAALTWSTTRAADQLDIALTLTSTLTATLDAVTHGQLEVKKAEAIARALRREEPDLRRLVEAEVLPEASGWTIPHLHEQIRKILLRLAPELAARRAETARNQRRVSFRAEPDDMLKLEAVMPVEEGALVRAALDHAAQTIKTNQNARAGAGHDTAEGTGDKRSMDQIRCDVLADALIGLTEAPTPPTDATTAETAAAAAESAAAAEAETETASDGTGADAATGAANSSPTDSTATPDNPATDTSTGSSTSTRAAARRSKHGLRSEVVVTVPLETITGDAEHPGYLSRYGPISAHIARRMAHQVAHDGYWRCAVTDDVHGTLLGLGRSTFTPAYQAPEYLKRFTNLRDQTCDFPGCRQPATTCDYDHTTPHPQGSTCECGGANRCGNHHRLKHETAWNVRRSDNPDHPPGSHIWTSPAGFEYLSSPATIGVPARPGDPEAARSDNSGGRTRSADTPAPWKRGEPVRADWAYDRSLPELPTAGGGCDRPDPDVTEDADENRPPF